MNALAIARDLRGTLIEAVRDDSDRSLAAALGLAFGLFYAGLVVVAIPAFVVGFITDGLDNALVTPLETQHWLLTSMWTAPTLAALYGAALYRILGRNRSVILGYIVYSTALSFVRFQPGGFEEAANTGDALWWATLHSLPIVILPAALWLGDRVQELAEADHARNQQSDATLATDGGDGDAE